MILIIVTLADVAACNAIDGVDEVGAGCNYRG